MRMRLVVGTCCLLLLAATLSGCGDDQAVGSSGGDCVSYYEPVASAPSWSQLRTAMLEYAEMGRVGSVRVQARGSDLGYGDEDVLRIVDLVGNKGQRLVQIDVWRTEDGGWRSGIWKQCID